MNKNLKSKYVMSVKGQNREILMSFGLLNTLSAYFENPNQLDELFLNSQVRASVLVECLSVRDDSGRICEAFNLSLNELDTDEVMGLFEWVEEHLEDFFTKALARATARTRRQTRRTT